MIKQYIPNIIEACKGRLVQKGPVDYIEGISTDTRNLEEKNLFIPLIGENFDGHDFITKANENGASAVLYQKDKKIPIEMLEDITVIEVEDTLIALQQISKYYKEIFPIPFIGVTGSVGKTSTKDMISSVLANKHKVLKNIGNFNNHIGLPLTIFNLNGSHEIAVLEMGMSGFGEIQKLAEIVEPSIAVITNIGVSHIENLGSRENIMKAKLEITAFLKENEYLLLNGDNDLLKTLRKEDTPYRKIFFGLTEENDIFPKDLVDLGEEGFSFTIEVEGVDHRFMLKQPGLHNVYNALAAIWIGLKQGMDIEAIKEGLRLYAPSKMRMEMIELQDMKIINDAYNASPDSMEAALSVLAKTKGKRKIAVLGDMFEMGHFSETGHRLVGKYVVDHNIDVLITVGDMAQWIGNEALEQKSNQIIYTAKDNKEAINVLNNMINNEDVILIKASRGMAMEEIAHYLQERS
ncbi:MAG: UDP-N-acetylmuramoyl-tripeptide--D-alanyl-D-alanine ligase [Clostridiaceae bacterium]|nr:UDP-N-acetylmuramoyl-tripeptide--D-alanyl-D-alanine ligase [Clostridiaceae bacterium]